MLGKNSKTYPLGHKSVLEVKHLLPLVLTLILVYCLGGLSPLSLTLRSDLTGLLMHPWQLLTYGFVHHSIEHLSTTILALTLVGLSRQISVSQFYTAFLSAVLVGGISFVLLYGGVGGHIAELAGSSAGICGLIPIVLFLDSPFCGTVISKVSWVLLVLLGVGDIIYGLTSLYAGFWAHVGGYVTGVVYLYCWRKMRFERREKEEVFQKLKESGYSSLTDAERALLPNNK